MSFETAIVWQFLGSLNVLSGDTLSVALSLLIRHVDREVASESDTCDAPRLSEPRILLCAPARNADKLPEPPPEIARLAGIGR